MQGSYSFEAPLEVVWNALFDPEVLARTMPGCEKLEREGNQFKGDINVKMGPVQGKFQGKVDIVDIKERESYTMIVDGRGPAGFGKATAHLRVRSEGSGTRLDYDSDVTVGGKIASVGQRLLDASSRAIVKQSLEGLHQQIKALAAGPVAVPAVAEASVAEASAAEASAAGPSVPAVPAATVPAAPHPAFREGPAPTAPGTAAAAAAPGANSSASPDPGWFGVAAPKTAGAPAAAPRAPNPPAVTAPAVAPPAAPSQASFVFGVAKEVAKEMLPLRAVLLVIALLVLAWAIYRSVSGGS